MTGACAGCSCGAALPVRFTMAFQPIVDAAADHDAGRIVAHEALVRGTGGELAHTIIGAIPPEARAAFDRACRETAIALAARLGLAARLHLNLVPGALADPEACLAPTFAAAEAHGIAPQRITIELIEDGRLFDARFMRRLIGAIRAAGAAVALDDFGAGFAGPSLLAALSPDIVKLDLKLIRGIDRDRVKRGRALDVIEACRGIGLGIIAEGVETEGELAVLLDGGVTLIQGYLFARPAFERLMPEGEIGRPGLSVAA